MKVNLIKNMYIIAVYGHMFIQNPSTRGASRNKISSIGIGQEIVETDSGGKEMPSTGWDDGGSKGVKRGSCGPSARCKRRKNGT